MTGPEPYARLLSDHTHLRHLLTDLAVEAFPLTQTAHAQGPPVLRTLDSIATYLLAHHADERASLSPRLRARGPLGTVLARHMEEMHRYQVSWLRELQAALAGGRSALEIGVRAMALVQILVDDLSTEDRWIEQLVTREVPLLEVSKVA